MTCRPAEAARVAQPLRGSSGAPPAYVEPTLQRNLPAEHFIFALLRGQQALNAQARGETQRALDLANQAVAIMQASINEGRGSAGPLPAFLVSRSDIQQQLGHKKEAEGDARLALKMLLDTAQPGMFSSKLGRAYFALGRALQAQDKREEARTAFRSAVEHMQSALGPDHTETRAARQLAEVGIPLR